MIALYEKIDIKIKTEEKVSVYPITVKLELNDEDKAAIERFKEEIEAEYKTLFDAGEEARALSAKVTRLSEDIADINEEIGDLDATEKEERKRLRAKRKKLRAKLREAEDALAKINEQYDLASYTEAQAKMQEEIAKTVFDVRVENNEKKEALVKALQNFGIRYSIIIEEVGRLIQEAKQKKKKRS